jgi:hypothetical protein
MLINSIFNNTITNYNPVSINHVQESTYIKMRFNNFEDLHY